jgi:hypothetical protein
MSHETPNAALQAISDTPYALAIPGGTPIDVARISR